MLASALVGACLGVAGAVMQGMTRNPLASPSLMGLNAGAGLFLVLGLAFFPAIGFTGLIVMSFIGAGAGAALVFGIGSAHRGGLPRCGWRSPAPRPGGGAVYLDDKALHSQSTKAIARELAVLPQNPDAPGGVLVRELVGYGRFPWQSGLSAASREDREKIAHALELTGMTGLADRPVGTLSGGQRQRAWIAMALAQDSRILLLDEPTTFLDMAHQFEVLSLLDRLNADQGRTIVMVVHDLNHATRHAHHMIAIRDGAVVASGAPAAILTPEVLEKVFGIAADLIEDPRTGTTLCVPCGLAAT